MTASVVFYSFRPRELARIATRFHVFRFRSPTSETNIARVDKAANGWLVKFASEEKRIFTIGINKAQDLGRDNRITFACIKPRLAMLIGIQSNDLSTKICFVHQSDNWGGLVDNGLIHCGENSFNSQALSTEEETKSLEFIQQ